MDWDARPGAVYEVTFICNTSPTSTAKVTLTVAEAAHSPTPGSTSLTPSGVQGGLGGFGRMNVAEIAGGTALAVVAATGALFLVGRRRENRHH